MVVRVADVMAWLDAHAPFRYAADWDNSGLQVGDPNAEVARVMVSLDVTANTLTEAATKRCQCLVTHHPLIFQPLKTLRLDQPPAILIGRAIRNGIHLIAAHTNLDAARDGTNQQLVRMLGLERCCPLDSDPRWQEEERYAGMGAMGELPEPSPLESFVAGLQRLFPSTPLRVVGDGRRLVQRIGLCTGSGAGFIEKVIAGGCDAFVSGDFKYHEARRAEEAGLALVDLGHFASERLIVEPLAEALRAVVASSGFGVEVLTAGDEHEPFRSVVGAC
jgi:dinuclear metal center YbgI/SA1388 family protein